MTDDSGEGVGFEVNSSKGNERVDHAAAVYLHETSRSAIMVKPFFIKRSAGTDVTLKLQKGTNQTMFAKAPMHFVPKTEINLNAQATAKLHHHLTAWLEAAGRGVGKFVTVPIQDGGQNDVLDRDSLAQVVEAAADMLKNSQVTQSLTGELGSEIVLSLHSGMRVFELRAALSRLREMLDDDFLLEKDYQSWCDQHSWAFGNAYVMRDEVRDIAAGDSVDMLLPSTITGLRDIVELKKPVHPALVFDRSHKNYHWSGEVSKAIGQVQRYLDKLHDRARKGLDDHPDIVAYHPRATIVIGRSNEWKDEQVRTLHALNARLVGITVMTYDHLLALGEQLVSLLTPDRTAEGGDEVSLS